jgi:hypothetical protein
MGSGLRARRPRRRTPAVALAGAAFVVASPAIVAAQPAVEQPFWKRLEAHGYVDVYAAYNGNRPADGASFLPGTGTTAKRADEFGLSQAAVGVSLEPEPVGFNLTLNAGSGAEIVHSGEPVGPGTGPGAWNYIQRATVAGKIPIGNGLLVEAGIMPSHVGLETLPSKDNWTYTRSWMAELSPYYETGIKLEYEVLPAFTAGLYLVNGWQTVGDVNHGKTLGAKLAYTGDRLTVALAGLAGPELPNDDTDWRVFGDLYAIVKATRWLSLAATVDVGAEHGAAGRPLAAGEDRSGHAASAIGWYGVAAYARAALLPFLAIAARGEVYDDPHAALSGFGQRLVDGTVTLEGRPHEAIVLKLEARYDRSTTPVFSLAELGPNGTPERGRDQALVVLGAVAMF